MSASPWREPLLAVGGLIVAVGAAAIGIALYFHFHDDSGATTPFAAARITVVIVTASARPEQATPTPPPPTATSSRGPATGTAVPSPSATPSATATATRPTATATPSTPSPTPTATASATPTPKPGALVLQRTTFVLPSDAEGNGGRTIGPFCCRGRTVTLKTTAGEVVGYAYWFQWQGQAYDVPRGGGFDGIYPDIRVLVNDVSSGTVTIALAASEMSPGVTRSVTTDRFRFTVTLTGAEQTTFQGATYVWESSLAATLAVEVR